MLMAPSQFVYQFATDTMPLICNCRRNLRIKIGENWLNLCYLLPVVPNDVGGYCRPGNDVCRACIRNAPSEDRGNNNV